MHAYYPIEIQMTSGLEKRVYLTLFCNLVYFRYLSLWDIYTLAL